MRAELGRAPAHAGRFELLRALGALCALDPCSATAVAASLELPVWSRAEHTLVFVLELPPYASVHLGAEGKLGGEGGDRVAGCWRALGLNPPADADHLANILDLYAELGESALTCRTARARERLTHARETVLWEHLWSWVPGYLDATCGHGGPATASWARLVRSALVREARSSSPAATLPLALRAAPPPIDPDAPLGDLLDALVAPVRVGFVLTHDDLACASQISGVGLRRGERRFALRAMIEQDAAATVASLANHARRWAALHRDREPVGLGAGCDPACWWTGRAEDSARALDQLHTRARSARHSCGASARRDATDP